MVVDRNQHVQEFRVNTTKDGSRNKSSALQSDSTYPRKAAILLLKDHLYIPFWQLYKYAQLRRNSVGNSPQNIFDILETKASIQKI